MSDADLEKLGDRVIDWYFQEDGRSHEEKCDRVKTLVYMLSKYGPQSEFWKKKGELYNDIAVFNLDPRKICWEDILYYPTTSTAIASTSKPIAKTTTIAKTSTKRRRNDDDSDDNSSEPENKKSKSDSDSSTSVEETSDDDSSTDWESYRIYPKEYFDEEFIYSVDTYL